MNNYKKYLIEVNQSCNLNCTYCHYNVNKVRENGNIDFELFSGLKGKEIWLTGGEPFMHPRMEEMIVLLTQKNSLNIFTNGTLLHRHPINLLNKISKLMISIDDFDIKNNDLHRGQGSRVLENLEWLQQQGMENFFIKRTITKENYHNLHQYLVDFTSKGFKRFSFNIVTLLEQNRNYELLAINREKEILQEIFQTLDEWKDKIYFDQEYNQTLKDFYLKGTVKKICPGVKREFCFIDHQGRLERCPLLRVRGQQFNQDTRCVGEDCITVWEMFNH